MVQDFKIKLMLFLSQKSHIICIYAFYIEIHLFLTQQEKEQSQSSILLNPISALKTPASVSVASQQSKLWRFQVSFPFFSPGNDCILPHSQPGRIFGLLIKCFFFFLHFVLKLEIPEFLVNPGLFLEGFAHQCRTLYREIFRI